MLARAGKYDNVLFHRLVPGFMVCLAWTSYKRNPDQLFLKIQAGDPTGTGAGGESYWGTPFRDEHDLKGAAKHDSRGVLAMANKGPGTNGLASSVSYAPVAFDAHTSSSSQFYLTFKPAPNLDKKHTVFGKLVGGEDILDALERLPLKDGTERPAKPVRITEVIMYVYWSSRLHNADYCDSR